MRSCFRTYKCTPLISIITYFLFLGCLITLLLNHCFASHFSHTFPSSCFMSHHPVSPLSPRDVVPAPRLCRSQAREMIKKLQGDGRLWQGGGAVTVGRGEHWECRFQCHVALYLLIHYR